MKVAVTRGRVTLTGTDDDWDDRDMAGTAARAAPGVTSVVNDIRAL